MPPHLAGWTNGPAVGSDPGLGGHAHHKERGSSIAYNHTILITAKRFSCQIMYFNQFKMLGLKVGCHEVALLKFYKFPYRANP
jgi:hypothetical protein